jgi:hypothetical protein
MVKIGDRLVVHGMPFPAYVEKIEDDPGSASTILYLDWGQHGKSRVFLHDQGKVWELYSTQN